MHAILPRPASLDEGEDRRWTSATSPDETHFQALDGWNAQDGNELKLQREENAVVIAEDPSQTGLSQVPSSQRTRSISNDLPGSIESTVPVGNELMGTREVLNIGSVGSPGRIRTCDLAVNSRPLYR